MVVSKSNLKARYELFTRVVDMLVSRLKPSKFNKMTRKSSTS